MKKTLALFDFDGTITIKDTLLEIIRFHQGNYRMYLGFLQLSPYLFLFKLKLLSNTKAKERILQHFFGGIPIEKFNKLCEDFCKGPLLKMIRPLALQCIKNHLKDGHEVWVVSASAENWVSPWCKLMGISVMATKLEINQNKITGKILGENCYGEEKLNQIKKVLDLNQYDQIFSYGDSDGDRQMLDQANFPNFKPFR